MVARPLCRGILWHHCMNSSMQVLIKTLMLLGTSCDASLRIGMDAWEALLYYLSLHAYAAGKVEALQLTMSCLT